MTDLMNQTLSGGAQNPFITCKSGPDNPSPFSQSCFTDKGSEVQKNEVTFKVTELVSGFGLSDKLTNKQ